jgi:prolyl oligopeptidase
MTMISRRDLLISSSVVGLTTLARGAWAQTDDIPPVASVRPGTEHLHGATVTDPYRWMENPADPEWKPYLMGQNAYARRVLGSLKGRNELAARIDALSGTMEPINDVQLAGRYVFVERRPAGANTFKIYVREGLNGADRLLVDPDRQATGSTHYSLDYWQASPDGQLVAFGTSPAGSEASVMRFVDTASGKVLPDAIDGALWNTFTWSPDSSVVFVNRTKAGAKSGDIDRFLDSAVWRHRLGTDLSTDIKIMARGLHPSVAMKDIGEPVVVAHAGQAAVLGIVQNGVENELDVYVAQLSDALAGRPHWATVCKVADGVTGVVMHRGDIYLLSHDRAPHSKVLKARVADPTVARANVILPEGRRVLKAISAERDALYVSAMDAGLGQVLRLLPDGSLTSLRLPFPGTVFGLRTDPLQDGCWFSLESWVKPPVICFGRPDGTVVITDIAPKPPIDVDPYESREVTVTARDGAKVPLSIIYRKGVHRDGSAPLYLQAYGAYGLDLDPGFGTSILPWLDLGGVMAVAHVRGGGELGQEWYKGGQLLTKPNTWRDCIDCAEYLIAENGPARPNWLLRAPRAVESWSDGS